MRALLETGMISESTFPIFIPNQNFSYISNYVLGRLGDKNIKESIDDTSKYSRIIFDAIIKLVNNEYSEEYEIDWNQNNYGNKYDNDFKKIYNTIKRKSVDIQYITFMSELEDFYIKNNLLKKEKNKLTDNNKYHLTKKEKDEWEESLIEFDENGLPGMMKKDEGMIEVEKEILRNKRIIDTIIFIIIPIILILILI